MILLTSVDLYHMRQVKVDDARDRPPRGERLCVRQSLHILLNEICKLIQAR